MSKHAFLFYSSIAFLLISCGDPQAKSDPFAPIAGKYHFIDGYSAITKNDHVNVIIEIPTGTTAKWEVNKNDGKLHWEIKNGKPRIVDYLGYLGNYGMIPRTLLSYETGGDGDPLDVLVLGPPVPRGSVVEAKIIGSLQLSDGGEQDDKLIAVMEGNNFYSLESVTGLKQAYPTIPSMIQMWFENYKGPGKITSSGFYDAQEAKAILEQSIKIYEAKQ